jgi:hypothetical protein
LLLRDNDSIDVSEFTGPDRPFEIAYADRGPVDVPGDTAAASARNSYMIGGSWGAYYCNNGLCRARRQSPPRPRPPRKNLVRRIARHSRT